MKTFSKEKLLLEHYVKTAEEVMDEVTVRVWKPKTMQKLPAVCMRGVMQSHRRSVLSARDIYWGTGNPDYGDLPKGKGSLTYEQVLSVMDKWDDIEDTSNSRTEIMKKNRV